MKDLEGQKKFEYVPITKKGMDTVERKVRMRAARLKDFNELNEEQQNELIQLLKTDSLVLLEPDGYYVMRGDHLITMFETMMEMQLKLERR